LKLVQRTFHSFVPLKRGHRDHVTTLLPFPRPFTIRIPCSEKTQPKWIANLERNLVSSQSQAPTSTIVRSKKNTSKKSIKANGIINVGKFTPFTGSDNDALFEQVNRDMALIRE